MLSWRRRATSIHCSPSPRGNRTGSSVCCVFPGAAPPSGRILSKRKAGSKTPESKRFRGLKLSTKCRQLESPKWKLPKKFPFWQELNVKGGIPSPSPLHNPPMRVQASPHRFVYSLRPRNHNDSGVFLFWGTRNKIEFLRRLSYNKIYSHCVCDPEGDRGKY